MAVEEMLPKFARADWMMWLLWHSKTANIRQMVKLACVCARISLRHVPHGEERPRLAIEAAETWVSTPTGAARDAMDAAGDAAWAAGDAARAAGDAAGAAGDAAWAARDARAAAGAAEHKVLCAAILAEMETTSFKSLGVEVK
jgi:hypothetical protein